MSGINPDKILECADIMLLKTNGWQNPFGDGHAGEKIISIIYGDKDG